ncbi:MAG: hypothetical protein D6732_22195 [Methanobacteriota archaeon]|nr:MAG: hypothetical protein D6732_22195 [Euryarchaeota archaeon]
MNRYQIRRWFFRKDFENSFEEFRVPPERIRGMLIPISRREQPEWILRWLRPQTVVFLYTPKTQNIARQLTEEFGEQITFPISVADIDAGKYCLENAFDPEAAYAIAQSLIQMLLNRGIDASQIFVDTTGGTVPMSIGCFQAAEEAGVSSIYVMGTQKGVIKLPQKQEHGEPIFLSDHSK